MVLHFTKSFTRQEPISESIITEVIEVLRDARLHRYNVDTDELSKASELESAFARWQGCDYVVACTSGGYALHLALSCAGVESGDLVLANAYTLAPVPGAMFKSGAIPVFVEIDDNWHIDFADLERKAEESGAKYLLLSHMRGHISDMDKITNFCSARNITLIEDCAHTMGAHWKNIRSGNFGEVSVFSTQTYKHINSGEGGLLITDNPEIAAKAILYTGSYMLYDRHGTLPPQEFFDNLQPHIPNYSGRMDNLRATLILGQLSQLEESVKRWNSLYSELESSLSKSSNIVLSSRVADEKYVGSSLQFRVKNLDGEESFNDFLNRCANRGVELKWFGSEKPHGFTSRYDSWKYLGKQPDLPNTRRVLSTTCDIRLPLTFNQEDCSIIGQIICEEAGVE